MSHEVRIDEIENRYVIIAPHRNTSARPNDFKDVARLKKGKSSPFLPGVLPADQIIETYGGKPWKIAVAHNRFPGFTLENTEARGTQELVIETNRPDKELHELPVRHIKQIFDIYANRTQAISQIPGLDYVVVFKNNGPKAGASIQHAHSQIWGTEKAPLQLLETIKRMDRFREKTGKDYYRDLIQRETRGPRMVYKDAHIVAFTPYASIFSYEVWILTRKQRDNIRELSAEERLSLATLMKKLTTKIRRKGFDYNYFFHEIFSNPNQHFHVKVMPRPNIWAGFEVGTGMVMNPTPPEEAAIYYRGK